MACSCRNDLRREMVWAHRGMIGLQALVLWAGLTPVLFAGPGQIIDPVPDLPGFRLGLNAASYGAIASPQSLGADFIQISLGSDGIWSLQAPQNLGFDDVEEGPYDALIDPSMPGPEAAGSDSFLSRRFPDIAHIEEDLGQAKHADQRIAEGFHVDHFFQRLYAHAQEIAGDPHATDRLVHLAHAYNKTQDLTRHMGRVAKYTAIIADQMGIAESDIDTILWTSSLHDIGKVRIPDEILNNHRKLTREEFAIMQNHPVYGAQMLTDDHSTFLTLAARIALTHHENYDGTGYPNRLKGNQIPMEARILRVADVLDSLTSRRSYKEPWSLDDAFKHISMNAGRLFDPVVVSALECGRSRIQEALLQNPDR